MFIKSQKINKKNLIEKNINLVKKIVANIEEKIKLA